MKASLGTIGLVAASVQDHVHRVQSFGLVTAVKQGGLKEYISTQWVGFKLGKIFRPETERPR